MLTRWHNNDHQEDDHANDQTHAHLHVLPPHILAHAIGASAEALGRDGEVVGLVLQRIQVLTTLRDLVDVFAHHTDSVVDLCLQCGGSLVAILSIASLGTVRTGRDIGVVGLFVLSHYESRKEVWEILRCGFARCRGCLDNVGGAVGVALLWPGGAAKMGYERKESTERRVVRW
jgi:hypothetical protein